MKRQSGWIRHIREAVRYRRLLHSLAKQYVASRYYGGLSRAESKKLRKLDRKGFTLALGIFAYDARKTSAAILELGLRGDMDEALNEKVALTARSLGGWAFQTVGLALPHGSLFEHADSLGVGLGSELKQWLVDQDDWLAEADAWFRAYASAIERFEFAAKKA